MHHGAGQHPTSRLGGAVLLVVPPGRASPPPPLGGSTAGTLTIAITSSGFVSVTAGRQLTVPAPPQVRRPHVVVYGGAVTRE
jgi:hypothetical protein